MKQVTILILVLFIKFGSFGQGTVRFQNVSGTGVPGGSPITNALTGARVPAGNSFLVQLYYGPVGASEDQLISTGAPIGFASAGLFDGGVRMLSEYIVGDCGTSPIQATLQVRSWQASLGMTYESALRCAGAGGVIGKSEAFTITVGNPCSMPPSLPPSLSGLRGFVLIPCPPLPLPSLRINDITVAEGTNGTVNAVFEVTLSSVTAQPVSVTYTTVTATALAGVDYRATSGILSFSALQTNRFITVVLTPDAAPELDETFAVNLSNPSGATIAKGHGVCTIVPLSVTAVGLHVDVSFTTSVNRYYRVEWTEDTITWAPVAGATNVRGTGSIVTIIDNNVGCRPMRAYRVRLLL